MNKITKKKSTKKKSPRTPIPSTLAIAPPPAALAPVPPAPVDPTAPIARGNALIPVLAPMAAAVAAELRGASTFTQDFGAKLTPPPGEVAAALDAAAAWHKSRTNADDWRTFLVRGENDAWRATLRALQRYRRALVIAAESDAEVRTRYPQLAAFLATQSVPKQRGAATRAERRKAEAEKNASEQPAPPPQPAPAHPTPNGSS